MQSDVFTLGVILYWLLTDGRFPGETVSDFEHRQREQEPQPIPPKCRFSSSLSPGTWPLSAAKRCKNQTELRYQIGVRARERFERAAQGQLPLAAGSRSSASSMLRWVRRRPSTPQAPRLCSGSPSTRFRFRTRP